MNEDIERYFEQQLSEEGKAKFESELISNQQLAEEVAFYLSTKKAVNFLRYQNLERRHAEWQHIREKGAKKRALLPVWLAAAAMVVLALGLGWYFLNQKPQDLKVLADNYVSQNFETLSVHMGGVPDSMQIARNSYNEGDLDKANNICQVLLQRDSSNAEAKEMAGIVALRQLEYDKAIAYFHSLSQQTGLHANPGKFYEAIALIQSGLPLNKKKAERLLKEVIDGNLEGKQDAEKWIK